ncbi:zinc finger, C2H2 type [Ancylostoma ceylanicum]|uniref:Signal recognition particle receptor subunit beta n=1 Tax=Ancylostoma ceylanicum TaxID=53326 RepID=A0A0D6M7H9_9BILA|nr:zinc finger, C2H2 type [Ancylostoma ceylanicum]
MEEIHAISELDIERGLVTCPSCGRKFAKNSDLARHCREQHSGGGNGQDYETIKGEFTSMQEFEVLERDDGTVHYEACVGHLGHAVNPAFFRLSNSDENEEPVIEAEVVADEEINAPSTSHDPEVERIDLSKEAFQRFEEVVAYAYEVMRSCMEKNLHELINEATDALEFKINEIAEKAGFNFEVPRRAAVLSNGVTPKLEPMEKYETRGQQTLEKRQRIKTEQLDSDEVPQKRFREALGTSQSNLVTCFVCGKKGGYWSLVPAEAEVMGAKSKYVIVQLASVITGSTRVWVRERAAEKFSGSPEMEQMASDGVEIDVKPMMMEPTAVAVCAFDFISKVLNRTSLFRALRDKANTFLIVGLSDSGKTHIFGKIANKNLEPVTYTSFQENVLDVEIKGKHMKVVDFPGAERLRKQLVEKWLKKERASLRGIAFVVDSSSFSKRARDVAEFLYDVALESGKKIPILIACNKQDHGLAKSSQVIRTSLEKEIGMINKTRAAALTTTDGSSFRHTLTDTGANFSWEDLPKPVEFVECCAVDGASNLFSNDPMILPSNYKDSCVSKL